jgi:hypothetical protein
MSHDQSLSQQQDGALAAAPAVPPDELHSPARPAEPLELRLRDIPVLKLNIDLGPLTSDDALDPNALLEEALMPALSTALGLEVLGVRVEKDILNSVIYQLDLFEGGEFLRSVGLKAVSFDCGMFDINKEPMDGEIETARLCIPDLVKVEAIVAARNGEQIGVMMEWVGPSLTEAVERNIIPPERAVKDLYDFLQRAEALKYFVWDPDKNNPRLSEASPDGRFVLIDLNSAKFEEDQDRRSRGHASFFGAQIGHLVSNAEVKEAIDAAITRAADATADLPTKTCEDRDLRATRQTFITNQLLEESARNSLAPKVTANPDKAVTISDVLHYLVDRNVGPALRTMSAVSFGELCLSAVEGTLTNRALFGAVLLNKPE